ncbi:hypothetical protein [Corynebacterium guangdongense]|uniref:Gram-positive cocci surface proteins LPxTG domain-containing protein n=1 Tax=Corynebacterium guangdongense TaxID=1783348 RepID=A0ABU1ZUB0_9CORY|nr:hypothetical protein [Corynebacterium guangdongense]MDR7328516.1 hypothetical protein [Corynebacterium guangdongense]WJZ17093.1 hypothetical protein CGUA_02485 [Corynebacterium guangdongense]
MTRYRLTLTALTVSGALALGTAPAALAAPTNLNVQQSGADQGRSSGAEGSSGTTADVYITLDDTTYYRHQSGGWVSEQADAEAELTPELEEEIASNAAIIEEDRANGGEGLGGDSLRSDRLRSSEGADGSSGSSNISDVAGILLPAALVIGGTAWYLNQDGQTYVTEQSRAGAVPSEEEKAASEQMLNNNAAEVTEQAIAAQSAGAGAGADAGVVPAGAEVQADTESIPGSTPENSPNVAVAQRGMAAETGSNTLPRALAALALMSVLGAAVLALRRRRA